MRRGAYLLTLLCDYAERFSAMLEGRHQVGVAHEGKEERGKPEAQARAPTLHQGLDARPSLLSRSCPRCRAAPGARPFLPFARFHQQSKPSLSLPLSPVCICTQDLSTQRLSGGARIRSVFVDGFSHALRELAPIRDVDDAAILTVIKNGAGVAGNLLVPQVGFV